MQNKDIYTEAAAGVRLLQITDRLNLNDGNFSRKLRKELPPDEKERIRQIVAELKAGEADEHTD